MRIFKAFSKKSIPSIPTYRLYGEKTSLDMRDKVHCERISERSRMHDWHIQPHKHSRLFQLLLINRGGATVNLDGEHLRMQAGHAVGIPPGVIHGFDFDPDTEGYVVTIDDNLVEQILQRQPEYPNCMFQVTRHENPEGKQTLPKLFDCLAQSFLEAIPGKPSPVAILAEALFIAWVDETQQQTLTEGSKRQRAETHFYKFERLVNDHYSRYKTVAWYSNQLGLSPEHLNFVSNQVAGVPALAIIHQRLLVEAKSLLVFTTLNIEQVAQTLGFKDPAYFSRFFKKKMGMAPREFGGE